MADDNGNGRSGWRWTIGILLSIQGAVIGWLTLELGELRKQVYEGSEQSTRALLEERTSIYVPIILGNRSEVIRLDKELSGLEYRVRRLEGNGR